MHAPDCGMLRGRQVLQQLDGAQGGDGATQRVACKSGNTQAGWFGRQRAGMQWGCTHACSCKRALADMLNPA